MEDGTIFSISILTFDSKIFFLQKIPEFPDGITEIFSKKIMDIIRKNFLKDYLSNQLVYRHMNYFFNSLINIKISLIGKICVLIFYSTTIDINIINLYNEGLRMALVYLCRNKKIKIEWLMKRYIEVNQMIIDTLYFINPNFRFMFKKSEYSQEIAQNGFFNIYFQRFFFANEKIKKLIYFISTKNYSKVKSELSYNKNVNNNIEQTTFTLNSKMLNKYKEYKQKLIEEMNKEGIEKKQKKKIKMIISSE